MLNRLFITLMLIVLSSTMTKGQQKLYYWFDTPTTLRGQKVWYEGHRERCADGRQDERTNRCKPVAAGDAAVNPDPEWESQSIPLGNGSIGANVMGVGCGGTHNAQREDAVERRSQRRDGHEECSPLLGREQAIGSRDERHTPGV